MGPLSWFSGCPVYRLARPFWKACQIYWRLRGEFFFFNVTYVRLERRLQHQVLSVTDPRAISFILGEGTYYFPKPQGVRAWFKATLGEGILWVEGKCSTILW